MKKLLVCSLVVSIIGTGMFSASIVPCKAENDNGVVICDDNVYLSWDSIEENAENYRNVSNTTVQFIDSHISEMAQIYNSENEDKFVGEWIEKTLIVYILSQGTYATYLDFNEANGYMVVDEDYNLYEFKTDGDLTYLKDLNFAFYSEEKGFKYYNSDTDELLPFVLSDNSNLNDLQIGYENVGESTIYKGQDQAGDGKIYDIDAYVKDRYPDYTYSNTYSISNYHNCSQWDASIYLKYFEKNGEKYISNEGCCTMNATYSVLNSWRQRSLCPLLPPPAITIQYNPVEREPNHSAFLEAGWTVNDKDLQSTSAIKNRGSKAIDNVPQLYADVRQVVYERNYDYQLDSLDLGVFNNKIAYIMSFTLAKYSYFPKISNFGDDFSVMEFFFTQNGMAQMLIVNNSSSYNGHAMACYGYKKYTYKSGWWIFSSTKSAYFLKVDDGNSTDKYNKGKSIWYDPNASGSSKETLYVYDSANS